jgi:hypothetical protein
MLTRDIYKNFAISLIIGCGQKIPVFESTVTPNVVVKWLVLKLRIPEVQRWDLLSSNTNSADLHYLLIPPIKSWTITVK